jgi:hypothetical protein
MSLLSDPYPDPDELSPPLLPDAELGATRDGYLLPGTLHCGGGLLFGLLFF